MSIRIRFRKVNIPRVDAKADVPYKDPSSDYGLSLFVIFKRILAASDPKKLFEDNLVNCSILQDLVYLRLIAKDDRYKLPLHEYGSCKR